MRWSLPAVLLTALLFPCRATAAENTDVEKAITSGVAALRKLQESDGSWAYATADSTVGSTSLAALTLLMCGADKEDRAVLSAASYVRGRSVGLAYTYSIALAILFLDKLGDPGDVPLLESLAARLVAGQNTSAGGWSYYCPVPITSEQRRLTELVSRGRLGKGDRPEPENARQQAREFQKRIGTLSTASMSAGGPLSRPDNSNTQFATLALWVSRRHGFPVDGALRAVERHFRGTQFNDGGWAYVDGMRGSIPTPTMTCAGLLGVAIGFGVSNDKAKERGATPRDPAKDAFLKAGVAALARSIDVPPERILGLDAPPVGGPGSVPDPDRPGPPGPGRGPDGMAPRPGGGAGNRGFPRRRMRNMVGIGRLYYYLWSVERVAVALNLDVIGNKDWYAWGSRIILSTQDTDGTWAGEHDLGGVDTCFALLFLKRANLANDLTALTRAPALGRVSLKAGDAARAPAAKDDRAAKPDSTDRESNDRTAPPAKEERPAKPGATDRPSDTGPAPATAKEQRPAMPAAPATAKEQRPTAPDSRAKKDAPKVASERPPASPPKVASLGDTPGAKLAETLLAMSSEKQAEEIGRLRADKGNESTEALALAAPQLVPDLRDKARQALADHEGRLQAEAIGRDLGNGNAEIRRAAALACALTEAKQFIPQLIGLLDDRESDVGRAARVALRAMTGQDFGPPANADAEDRKRAVDKWQEWWKKQPH
jgi:hypothetical protein